MHSKVLAAVACILSIQGCASGPTQHQSDPELSVAANVAYDLSRGFTTNVRDGETGYDARYDRGSALGTLFNIGLVAYGAANPIAGLSPEMSALAHYSLRLDNDTPVHRQPLVFTYWPYNEGDSDLDGATWFMQRLDSAINAVAEKTNGTADMITDDAMGDRKVNAWMYTSKSQGCPKTNPCVLRANLTLVTAPWIQPADWYIERVNYESVVADIENPVKVEGAKHAASWYTGNNGGENRSNVMFLQDDMEDRDDMQDLYAKLSKELPSGVFLYVPPEDKYGIGKEYPYMLHEGEEVLFKTP